VLPPALRQRKWMCPTSSVASGYLQQAPRRGPAEVGGPPSVDGRENRDRPAL
jgi:hypothetical protein